MKVIINIFILFLLGAPFMLVAQDNGSIVIKENTRKAAVRYALKNGHRIFLEAPFTSCEEVIVSAEPLLFKVYGKKNIRSEKPYRCYSREPYWHMRGSLPQGYQGGVFELIINKDTGEVFKIIHGK